MSDTRLRHLERQALATGSPEDRAALLRERMRTGEVTRDVVELAAYCGDKVAQLVAPSCNHGAPCHCHNGLTMFKSWLRGLDRWPGALVRAAVAAAGCALAKWEATLCVDPDCISCAGEIHDYNTAPRRAIEAAAAWIACPCEEHYKMWAKAWNKLGSAKGWIAAPGVGPRSAGNVISLVDECSRLASPAAVRVAIRRVLILWALGEV